MDLARFFAPCRTVVSRQLKHTLQNMAFAFILSKI